MPPPLSRVGTVLMAIIPMMSAMDTTPKTGSSPMEVAAHTHRLLFVGLMAFTLLAALFTWLVSRSDSKLQDLFRADADARIAEAAQAAATANREAATAKEGAATANQSAAAANERAEKLERENLVLRSDVEAAKKNVATLEIETANARTRAASAEAQLLEIRQRLSPRHLTPEQAEALGELLRLNPGEIDIECIGGSPEPCRFADELVTVLTSSGWKIRVFDRAIMVLGGTPEGLTIRVQNEKTPRAVLLQRALGRIGFPAKGELVTIRPPDSVLLIVGSKPS